LSSPSLVVLLELLFWKAFKLDWFWRSGLPSWVIATQCNGPVCNCYWLVKILFDSGSTISLNCKNLLSLTNCT
ncbi:hypothetical protein T4A_3515, partial [Trichinella pseudospiralis]